MREKYYSLEGRTAVPCTLEKWAQLLEGSTRKVAADEIGGILISTVFLGLDHNFGANGPPLLFETMTFSDVFGEIQLRCNTYMQAEEMHQTVVDLVRTSLDQAEETAQDAIKRLKAMAL
jgi:hypothetical protein